MPLVGIQRRKQGDMNKIKLKPCPFCGGTNLYYAEGRFYAVECGDCGGKVVGAFRTEEDAAEAWNTRAKLKESDLPTQSTDAADVSENGEKKSIESLKKS